MLQRTDGLGFSGAALLVVGVLLFLTGSSDHVDLVYWVLGPLLWFLGFAMVVGWAVMRVR